MKGKTAKAPKVSGMTSSGARRAGDRYQDVRAAKLLVEWLDYPRKYRRVILENGDACFLDDITAETQDGKWILIQVKYTTDTEAHPLTFESLLCKPKGKTKPGKSLLEKWSASLKGYPQGQIELATVETNWPAGDDLQKCLKNGHVDLACVEAPVRSAVFQQLGEKGATELFSSLVFRVSLPGIDQMAATWQERLRTLNPQRHDAWNSLMKAIEDWIITPAPRNGRHEILLSDVRAAAGWFVLPQIDERFDVPLDTMLPDDSVFESMFADLSAENPVLEVIGPPGSGKSTLLTAFAERLKKEGHLVLRHHYFISTSDATERRYSTSVTVASLMHQIKEYGADLLGSEEERMSPDPHEPGRLKRWLDACALRLKDRKRRLVVIIDGLDNAYRESPQNAQQELEDVFQILLPPPEGMYVVIGSQNISEEEIPDALNRRVHRPTVRHVPPLSAASVDSWLESHGNTSMNVDQGVLGSKERRRNMAAAIIDASSGLPLAFRLLQHQAMASETPIDEQSVSRFPKVVNGDIGDYYYSLWAGLNQVARVMLGLLAQFRWSWPISGIGQCMRGGGYTSGEVDLALSKIRFLLSQDPGPTTVFHTSLSWFVCQQPDFDDWKGKLTDMAMSWLQSDAPDPYRRAHLWMIQASKGITSDLVEQPGRSWLVDSLRRHTPRKYISQILDESGRNALKQNRFDLFAQRSLLQDYVSNVFDYDYNGQKAVGMLLPGQLDRYASDDIADQLQGEIRNLDDAEIHGLFRYFQEIGDRPGAGRCLKEIQDRIAVNRTDGVHTTELLERLECLTDMQTCLPDTSADKFVSSIRRNRGTYWAAVMATDYGKAVFRYAKVELAHDLLKLAPELEAEEVKGCFPWLYALLIEQRSCIPSDVSDTSLPISMPWTQLLLMSSGLDCSGAPSVALPDAEDVFALDDPMQRDKPDRRHRIVDLFFSFVASYEMGHENAVREWCNSASSTEWLAAFVGLLAEVARSLPRESKSDSDGRWTPLYASFAGLDPSPRNEPRGDYFLAGDCRKALVDIMLLSSCMNLSGEKKHNELETMTALSSRWFLSDVFVQSLVDLNRVKAWTDVADTVCKSFAKGLHVEPEEGFMGCASRAALYSEFARQAGVEWMGLADQSCEYLVGYGSHKDIFMFDLLKCAEELSSEAPDMARNILSRVSGPALSVLSFTDGSETHGLPSVLASAMVSVCPDRILPYFEWLQHRERYRDAADAFARWVGSSAFDTDWDSALGATSSDSESILELQKRSEANPQAQRALAAVEQRFGGVDGVIQLTESTSSAAETMTAKRAPDPGLYPPDHLEVFLSDARSSAWDKDIVAGWLHLWTGRGRGQEAVDSLERLYHHDWRQVYIGVETYAEARSIIGKDAAFVWLIRANQGIRGWLSYYWNADRSEALWKQVRVDFPENWLTFIEATVYGEATNGNIGTRGMLSRLTRYLVVQEKTSAACDLALGACALLEQLTPMQLPQASTKPEWLEPL